MEDRTRYIYETNRVGLAQDSTINVDDVIETTNHFIAVDYLLSTADDLTEEWIKHNHTLLKQGTSDSRKS